MPIASNPKTGEVVYLTDGGAWERAPTAVNPQTNEKIAFDGKAWVPLGEPAGQATTEAPAEAGEAMSWGDVAKNAIYNTPSSAVQFGSDIIQPVLHPVETATAIKDLGHGVLQKIGWLSGDDKAKYAEAVGQFFVDRYGSAEGFKKAMATDPVGILGDVASVLTLGGGAAARAPGYVGKVGSIVANTGRAIDPVNIAAKGAVVGGRVASEVIGGIGTHTGSQPIREAAKAGFEGGAKEQAFTDAMRGNTPIGDVVTEAKGALAKIREDRGDAYRTAMKQIGQDQTVLDFTKIDNGIAATQNVKNFKGQDLSPKTKGIREEINGTVADWKNLDPKEFHTAEGLDALKQKIGDIAESAAHGTPERKVADAAYNAVRQTIVDQAPEYAKIMKGYEQASDLIKEIEKTLSLNPKANIDTTVRKLQSTLRNNVNSDFGKRGELTDLLVKAGATNLLSKLAGQSLSAWTPRGFGKLVAGGAGLAGLGGVISTPTAIAAAAASSPRIVGEAALVAGRAGRLAKDVAPFAPSSFQLGRLSRLQPQ